MPEDLDVGSGDRGGDELDHFASVWSVGTSNNSSGIGETEISVTLFVTFMASFNMSTTADLLSQRAFRLHKARDAFRGGEQRRQLVEVRTEGIQGWTRKSR